jgi:hypothetical protein
MVMFYGARSQKVQLDELLAAYGDGNFPINEFDENNNDDNNNYHQLDEALRELASNNDFISDSEDFFFFFFSENEDEPASQFPATATAVPARITTQLLQRYRKNGPFGKLHNIGAHLRKSSLMDYGRRATHRLVCA